MCSTFKISQNSNNVIDKYCKNMQEKLSIEREFQFHNQAESCNYICDRRERHTETSAREGKKYGNFSHTPTRDDANAAIISSKLWSKSVQKHKFYLQRDNKQINLDGLDAIGFRDFLLRRETFRRFLSS
jgi:hypothetical protein